MPANRKSGPTITRSPASELGAEGSRENGIATKRLRASNESPSPDWVSGAVAFLLARGGLGTARRLVWGESVNDKQAFIGVPQADSFRMLVESVKDLAICMVDAAGYVRSW